MILRRNSRRMVGLMIVTVAVWLGAFILYLYSAQFMCGEPDYITFHETVDVVVADRDIAFGAIVEADDITVQKLPEQFLPTDPLMAQDAEIYLGHQVGADIKEGDMLLTSDFPRCGVSEDGIHPTLDDDEPNELEMTETPVCKPTEYRNSCGICVPGGLL